MNLRGGLFVFIAATLFSVSAFSMQWMILEPSNSVERTGLEYNRSNNVKMFNKDFLVVDLKEADVRSDADIAERKARLQKLFGAKKVYLDLPVELIRPVAEETDGSAWHVDHLRYDELPAGFAGQGIVVAVIDTGVNHKHDQLINQMWVNEDEIPGDGIDNDNNGYADDVHGWDFVGDDPDPMETGHGTHCSGIIAAEKDPNSNAIGIATGARIMALRTIGGSDKNFISDSIQAIEYAVDNGANIMSNSWRIYETWTNYYNTVEEFELMREAIVDAGDAGVLFVAAAGNEAKDIDAAMSVNPIYPAGYKDIPSLVVVAASYKMDAVASFTNYGTQRVQIAAPGKAILSTYGANGWSSLSGTSMATPMVAGLLARGMSGGMTGLEAVDRLYQTAYMLQVWEDLTTRGMADAYEFLR